MESFRRDIRLAVRALRKSPGFAAVAVLTLALGIGASTALFSVVYGVWLNAYPYKQAGDILYPRATATAGTFSDSRNGVFRQREFLEIARVPAVADSAAYTLGGSVTIVGAHGPEPIPAFKVSAGSFSFLGVAPMLGRPIQPSDIRSDGEAERVAVLSFNLWRRLFGGAPELVGRHVALDGVPHLIIGVMPRRFGWGSNSLAANDGLYLPLSTKEQDVRVRAWVRLRDGISDPVAAQQFHARFLELAKVRPGSFPAQAFVTDLRRFAAGTGETRVLVEQMRASLRLLLFAVGFLLLIACANVANLQLARGSARARGFAIRLALGSSRWSVFRQLLTESVILAVAAGILGIFLAGGLTRLVALLIPRGYVPSESEIVTNLPILLVGLGISVVSGVLFGVIPAFQNSRADLNEILKDTGGGSGGLRGQRTRNLLVMLEVALSVVLVVGASLAIQGYAKLVRVDTGFQSERLFVVGFRIPPPTENQDNSEERNAFARDLLERIRALATIESATVEMGLAASGYEIHGAAKSDDSRLLAQAIGPNHMRTFGIPVRAGRDLSDQEVTQGQPVALINEAARQLWPAGQTPIGSTIKLLGVRGPSAPPLEATIVGIIGNMQGANETAPPFVFVPYTTAGLRTAFPTLTIRTRHDQPLRSADAVREQAFALNPAALLLRPIDLEEQFAAGRLQQRFNVALFASLAVIALALATAGIYAVLSYHVARQRREIGIRLSLGAASTRIISIVLGKAAWPVGIGLAAGVGISVALARIVKSQVFSVPETNPLALLVAVVVLSGAAACACYLPARRATRINPLSVLRSD